MYFAATLSPHSFHLNETDALDLTWPWMHVSLQSSRGARPVQNVCEVWQGDLECTISKGMAIQNGNGRKGVALVEGPEEPRN